MVQPLDGKKQCGFTWLLSVPFTFVFATEDSGMHSYTQDICKASKSVFNMFLPFEGNIYHYCPTPAVEGIPRNSTLRLKNRRHQTDEDEAITLMLAFQ